MIETIDTPAYRINTGDRIVLNGQVYRVTFATLVRGVTVDIKFKPATRFHAAEQTINVSKFKMIQKIG